MKIIAPPVVTKKKKKTTTTYHVGILWMNKKPV